MRNTTYALLISGLFSVMLMPSSFAMEGVANPAASQWRPLPAPGTQMIEWGKNTRQSQQKLRHDRWAGGDNYPQHGRNAYRFRPWKGQRNRLSAQKIPETSAPYTRPANGSLATPMPRNGYQWPQRVATPDQAYWRPSTHAASSGYPGHGANNRYRFRPLDHQSLRGAPARWTYRPAQIEIPNHYVYRPLKVNPGRHSTPRQRVRMPATPVVQPYGVKQWDPMRYGYNPMRTSMPYFAPPSHDPYRQVRSYNRYAAFRPSDRYYANRHDNGYPSPRGYSSPRYTGYTPFGRHRFRPMNRPASGRHPYPGQPAWLAANPYSAPNYSWRPSARSYPYGMAPAWQPQTGMPYPGMQQAMHRPSMPNPYGVNWYDGRADGEGAWYKLARQQEWPRVSQYSPMD